MKGGLVQDINSTIAVELVQMAEDYRKDPTVGPILFDDMGSGSFAFFLAYVLKSEMAEECKVIQDGHYRDSDRKMEDG